MKFVYDSLKANGTFIDIGAGLGEFTLIAASKITRGKLFAFEPSKQARDQLKANIALNSLHQKVQIISAVASDKNGNEDFNETSISEVSRISAGKTKNKIAAITLDTFCQKQKINKIDVLKIDVEGAELKVLKGLQKKLKVGKVEKLIVELNPNCRQYGYSQSDTVEFLEKLGYQILVMDNSGILRKFSLRENQDTINIIALKHAPKNLN